MTRPSSSLLYNKCWQSVQNKGIVSNLYSFWRKQSQTLTKFFANQLIIPRVTKTIWTERSRFPIIQLQTSFFLFLFSFWIQLQTFFFLFLNSQRWEHQLTNVPHNFNTRMHWEADDVFHCCCFATAQFSQKKTGSILAKTTTYKL